MSSKNNKLQDFIYTDLKADIHEIKKHIGILNDETGTIKVDIAKIKGKLSGYAIITPVITGLLGALIIFALTR